MNALPYKIVDDFQCFFYFQSFIVSKRSVDIAA